jgi:rubrerythrin
MRNDPTILGAIEPEVAVKVASRRDALKTIGTVAAVASAPLAFATMARKAYAQAMPKQVVAALQFALTLEQLEAAYYQQAVDADGLIPDNTRTVFEEILAHEKEHVAFLEQALGDKAGAAPELDFTAGGAFAPFEEYEQFLLLSQAFEDTGQRAYRGQAAELVSAPEVLTQALTIHSIEARHAARVRMIRDQQPWVPLDEPDAPDPVKPVYAGMDLTTKYEVDLTAITDVGDRRITEAFDEPLTKKQVLAIVEPFLA